MTVAPIAPDLYRYHSFDPKDDCAALRLLISARDAGLEQQGYSPTHPSRREMQLVFAILGEETRRAKYDFALSQGRQVTWPELEYLSNFGDWPEPIMGLGSTPGGVAPNSGYARGGMPQAPAPAPAAEGPYSVPFDPYQQASHRPPVPAVQPELGVVYGSRSHEDVQRMAQRASAGTRVGMALGDGFLFSVLAGMVLGASGSSGILQWLAFSLAMVLYVVGAESKLGGTPVKLLAGYEVRKVDTGERLSAWEATQRNWYRLINVLPGLGTIISFFGSIYLVGTISPENKLIGAHDGTVNAEVVKRRPRK